MIAGGVEGSSHYIWAGFDAMRVLCRTHNDAPHKASRPMSATAAGFVPGSGAGLLMLESLESALGRGARIYAQLFPLPECIGHLKINKRPSLGPESIFMDLLPGVKN